MEDESEDTSLVTDRKLRRRLQMRLGQRAYRRRQRLLERTLNAAEERLAQILRDTEKLSVDSGPKLVQSAASILPSITAEQSSADLPWGGIPFLQPGQEISKRQPANESNTSTSTLSTGSRMLARLSSCVSSASSPPSLSSSESECNIRPEILSLAPDGLTHIPPVLEQIPDLDYWTGLANIFVDSLGQDAPTLAPSSPSSQALKPFSSSYQSLETDRRTSESSSYEFEIALRNLNAQMIGAYAQRDNHSGTSTGRTFSFEKDLMDLERLAMYKTFRSRIDNTFGNVGLDQLSIYRAGTDTAAHLLKIKPDQFQPGALKTISVFFKWQERAGRPSPSPDIPDALVPTEDMLDCKPVPVQVAQIHHYWIDVMPWPGTRNNILEFMNRNANFDEFELGHDFFLGIRWRGGIPWDGRNYEISDRFYLKWGWILDDYAITTTDYWRRKRGLRSIRNTGRIGSLAMEGTAGKRKLFVEDIDIWGGEAIQHLVNNSNPPSD